MACILDCKEVAFWCWPTMMHGHALAHLGQQSVQLRCRPNLQIDIEEVWLHGVMMPNDNSDRHAARTVCNHDTQAGLDAGASGLGVFDGIIKLGNIIVRNRACELQRTDSALVLLLGVCACSPQ